MLQFITLDHENQTNVVWAAVNTIAKLKEGITYFLGANNPEEFFLRDTETDKWYKMTDIARKLDMLKGKD